MKYLYYFLLLCSIANHTLAQTPGGINYQGVARNQYLVGINTQLITLRFNIREKTISGASLYTEVRDVTTDSFGVFNVVIGALGAVSQSGEIKKVPWSDTTKKFLQVELDTHDPLLPPGFLNMGTTQLLSVPFSFYSDISDSARIAAKSDSAKFALNSFYSDSTSIAAKSDSAIFSTGSGKYFFSATIPVDSFQTVPLDNHNNGETLFYNYVVKFPRVLYNEGNVYDSLTSTFTAPEEGIYQFNINIKDIQFIEPVKQNKPFDYALRYGLMKNNTLYKHLTYSSLGGTDDNSVTKQVTIKLAKGDKITVRVDAYNENSNIQLGWFSDEVAFDYGVEVDPTFFAEFSGYKIK